MLTTYAPPPRRVPVKPYAPKPWDPGTFVKAEGRRFEVWSAGPVAASVWAVDVASGVTVAIKKPTPSRRAYLIDHVWRAR